VNGSLVVRPNVSTSYTLTVSGYGGTRTCNVYVSVSNPTPYVALSQIPYTGFDLGAAGNIIYWGALLSFALASSYLVLYYKGGAAAFAGAMIPLRRGRQKFVSLAKAAPVNTVSTSGSLKTPAIFAETPRAKAPVASAPSPIEAEFSRLIGAMPKDKMSFAKVDEGQAPRIVITRN